MITPRDLGWAAGFLEGEGTFSCPRTSPQIQASQVQRDPLNKLQRLFGGNIYACNGRTEGARPYFMWALAGTKAAAVMMTVAGLMSPRRFGQIRAALAPWKAACAGKGSAHAARTHCPHGHAYAGDNLYVTPAGERRCRACATQARATRARLRSD